MEVLIIIVIIGILIGLLLSAIQKARATAIRMQCQGGLCQMALAIHNYVSVHDCLPPGAIAGPFAPGDVPDGVQHSGLPLILVYTEQDDVAKVYQLNRNYDHILNQPAATTTIGYFLCRALPKGRRDYWTNGNYATVADYAPIDVEPSLAEMGLIDRVGNIEGPMPVNGMVKLNEITDGLSQTLLLVDAGGRPGVGWNSPNLPIGLRDILAGPHQGVTPAIMADSSSRILKHSLDLRLLGRMATRSGGEPVVID